MKLKSSTLKTSLVPSAEDRGKISPFNLPLASGTRLHRTVTSEVASWCEIRYVQQRLTSHILIGFTKPNVLTLQVCIMLFILTRQAYFISHKRLIQGQTYTLVNFDQAYTTNKSWWWVHFHKIMGIHLERVIRAQWKKGITGFNNPKTSKVNKGLRLKFNS